MGEQDCEFGSWSEWEALTLSPRGPFLYLQKLGAADHLKTIVFVRFSRPFDGVFCFLLFFAKQNTGWKDGSTCFYIFFVICLEDSAAVSKSSSHASSTQAVYGLLTFQPRLRNPRRTAARRATASASAPERLLDTVPMEAAVLNGGMLENKLRYRFGSFVR